MENSKSLLSLCEVSWARSKELITPGINNSRNSCWDHGSRGSAPAASRRRSWEHTWRVGRKGLVGMDPHPGGSGGWKLHFPGDSGAPSPWELWDNGI